MSPEAKPPSDEAVSLRYGQGSLALDLSRMARWRLVEAPSCAAPDVDALLRENLKAPLSSAGLASLVRGSKTVAVVVPDATRPPVARRLLPAILDELTRAGVAARDITIFIASGVHAPVTDEAARRLVGEVPAEVKIAQNRALSAETFRHLGTTRRGTPVKIARAVADADLRVAIGAVGFHYFAGVGGGRKLIVPGSSAAETARANHCLSLDEEGNLHPRCRSGVLEGNPVHEDMNEGMRFVERIFMVNVVLDGAGQIADLVAGDGVASHLEAARRAVRLLRVEVGRRCDLAIAGAGGDPLDVNLIQAHKSIDHAAESVRDGGVVVAVAECSGGVGSDTFMPWFGVGDTKTVARKLRAGYTLNGQTALSLLKKLERLKIILVSSLDRRLVEGTGITAAASLGEALGLAASHVGENPLTYVFPAAWGILPVAEEETQCRPD